MSNEIKKPSMYKAKSIEHDVWYVGYYFEMPETTYCFKEYGEPKMRYYLIFHQMTDWNLPNCAVLAEIDPTTLEEITE